MNKLLSTLLLSSNILIFSMDIGYIASDSDSGTPAATVYRYNEPMGDQNHIFLIPRDAMQIILLWADHKDSRSLLATCTSLHDTPYRLDCPESAITLPLRNRNASEILRLLAANRLVTYKNPLKIKVLTFSQENRFDGFDFFWKLNQGLDISTLCIENKKSREFLHIFSRSLERLTNKIDTLSLDANFFADNDMAIEFAENLSKNKSITALNLCGTNINTINSNGELVSMLMTNPRLKKLNFEKTGMQHDNISVLAQHLKNNTTLTSLSLAHNNLGSNSQNADLLADVLKTNTTLTELHLDNNDLKYAGTAKLAEGLMVNKTLKKVVLHNNNIGIKGARVLAPYDLEYNLKDRELVALDCSRSKKRLAAELAFRTTYLAANVVWAGFLVVNAPIAFGVVGAGASAALAYDVLFK